jgi:hypothetical protein
MDSSSGGFVVVSTFVSADAPRLIDTILGAALNAFLELSPSGGISSCSVLEDRAGRRVRVPCLSVPPNKRDFIGDLEGEWLRGDAVRAVGSVSNVRSRIFQKKGHHLSIITTPVDFQRSSMLSPTTNVERFHS